ncbi:MAG: V-type ATP synthase subunit I, partial [Bacteroidota bacterium]
MAVAAMSRLELFGLRADLPRIITLLQEAEAVEIEPAESESSTLVEPPAVSALERQIGDLERILAFFDRVAPRRANLIEQFAGVKTILTEREFITLAADAQAAERLSERVRAVEAGMAEIAARLHEERAMQAQLEPWSGLPLTRADLNGTRHVQIVLGLVPADRYADFVPALRAAEPRSLAAAVAGDGESVRTVIFWPRDAELAKVLADLPFNPISLPDFPDRVDEALAARAAWIHELQGKAAELAAEAARLAAERPRFEARLDYLRNEWAKLNAMRNLAETRHTFRLSGWIPTSRIEELRRTLDRGTQAYALATRPPLPEETVPVVMRNPGPIVPFEALIQGFSYPKYGEIDPTAVTAPFFFLFFGFCLADVGYGLTLILFCLALLRWLKMGPVGKKLAKLFIFGGIGAILMGVVTGSIFGDLIRIKAIINPIENALVLLGLALALGVIQLFLGTALSALPSLRQGQWRDAFFNQGMWLLFLSSVMLLLGKGA